MSRPIANPVVHLELRTTNPRRACFLYAELFDWSVETVRAGTRSYLALELSEGIQGGVVAHDSQAAGWLPYVAVSDIEAATERARRLGAAVTLEPREGPAGWRSVLAIPAGGEVALWQPKM
jgi:uncharacterized protein